MSEWVVPMVWTYQGHVVVEAETAHEAQELVAAQYRVRGTAAPAAGPAEVHQALRQAVELGELVDWDVGTPRRRA